MRARGAADTVAAMPDLTPERVRDVLRSVLFPNFRRDIVTLGMVGDNIVVEQGVVRLHLRPGTDKPEVLRQLVRAIETALSGVPGVKGIAMRRVPLLARRATD